jgi:glycosyltransferase involved in cell wall biosynthesis
MKSVLVVHPQFSIVGGAEQVSLGIIDVIISRFNAKVTLLTFEPCSPANLHHAFHRMNAQLETLSFKVADSPQWLQNTRKSFHLLKLAYLHRAAKLEASQHDVCVSTYNELDFRRPGFQYVHHPSFASRHLLRSYNIINQSNQWDRIPLLDRLYRRFGWSIAKDSIQGFQRNTTAVNSYFIRDVLLNLYGIDARVIYPSIVSTAFKTATTSPWEQREFQFASIGRISPDKNYSELLDIYGRILERFRQAKFIIMGRVADSRYYRQLLRKSNALNLKVEFLTDRSDEELEQVLRTSKFYLSPKRFEHFGIATLNAILAGCVPLVHDSGGQREIITPSILRYRSADGLVCSLVTILSNESMRRSALSELSGRLQLLNPERFKDAIAESLHPFMTS